MLNGFIAILTLALIELFVSGTWRAFYFRHGLVLFRKTVRVPALGLPSADELNGFYSGGWIVPLRFEELSPNEIAFRESLLSFRLMQYTPVMHGLIRYDEERGELSVVGRANSFMLASIAGVIAIPFWYGTFDRLALMPGLALLAVVILIYLIQIPRFIGVVASVRDAAS